jgi:hypoxanthine phosphoribosyltransferase
MTGFDSGSMRTPAPRPPPPAGRVLLSAAKIRARVRELGAEITAHYRGRRPLFLGVMNGALFFLTDLLRMVELDTEISCVTLASYAGTKSIGVVRGLDALGESMRGRQVLVVDDILDTGNTMAQLVGRLRELGAAEVKICVLLQKRHRHKPRVRADWVGFRIRDEFVVGYGLDHDGRHRGLKDIRALSAAA